MKKISAKLKTSCIVLIHTNRIIIYNKYYERITCHIAKRNINQIVKASIQRTHRNIQLKGLFITTDLSAIQRNTNTDVKLFHLKQTSSQTLKWQSLHYYFSAKKIKLNLGCKGRS